MPLPLIPLIIGGAATAIGGIATAVTTKSVADRVESARDDYDDLYSTYENIVGVLKKMRAACEPMYPLVPNWNRFVNASSDYLDWLPHEDQKLIAEAVKNVKNLKISSQLSRELDLSGTEDKVACFIATGIFNIIPGLGSALVHSMADDEIERIEQASAQIKREIKEIKSMLDEHSKLLKANKAFRRIRSLSEKVLKDGEQEVEWLESELKTEGFSDFLSTKFGKKKEIILAKKRRKEQIERDLVSLRMNLPDYARVDEDALLKSISKYVSR